MRVAALIVAAGRGTRAGGGLPKQYRALRSGRSVIAETLSRFTGHPGIAAVVTVIHPDDAALYQAAAGDWAGETTPGGADRADSVRNGLAALSGRGFTHVLIHDAARPFVSDTVINGVLEALKAGAAGAIPALPVVDTLHRGAENVRETPPRDGLWRAQTPQGFDFETILKAHIKAANSGDAFTDDAHIAAGAGVTVVFTPGDEDNFKLTTPEDFARAARQENPMKIRTGQGYDVHKFGPGDHVMLCGVKVPHDQGFIAHSDGDVGLHAITDALMGAVAAGDIGRHFPPSEDAWKGMDSAHFLRRAVQIVSEKGFEISNIDATLICERPKIGPHAEAMQARVAAICGAAPDQISVKATTSEGLGFTGRREGIAAMAIATVIAK